MDDDIIRMAREAGWSFMEAGMDAQRLARFAALVRAAEREKVMKEIEDAKNNAANR